MSDMYRNRIEYLLRQYSSKTASDAEVEELTQLFQEGKNDEQIKAQLEKIIHEPTRSFDYTSETLDEIVNQLLRRASGAGQDLGMNTAMRGARIRSMLKRVAVAASILFVAGLGSYLLFFYKTANQTEIAQTQEERFKNDVKAPETNRAMITLGDGSMVYLDSALNGELAQEGNIKLIKLDNGKIAYQTASGAVINEIKYNTLNNPKGSNVINMVLSDGSVVWLNAGSSVTYPIAFVGKERRVTISGEAYFEIAHDAGKPFVVSKGAASITVLGTHFNVNAFEDEKDIKVTLLEGSVEVSHKDTRSSKRIKPGEQAITGAGGEVSVVGNVDLDQVMAWKNGLFDFREVSIETIMQELSRWYGIDVKYEAKINQHYMGKIYRNSNASEVLKMLEVVGGVHFRIEGNQVTVMK